MKRKIAVSALIVLALLAINMTLSSVPVSACLNGCTPGFWKQEQHFGYWTPPYNPDVTAASVFAAAAPYIDPGDTLLDALEYHGGGGMDGAVRILLRAATATLLSSAYDAAHGLSWNYWPTQISPDRIVAKVSDAIATGDREAILREAEWFTSINELGCPL